MTEAHSPARSNAILACAVAACLAGSAAAESHLRVATYSLPGALGNVHRSTSSSEIYIWAALFDPLTMVDDNAKAIPWLATSWESIDPLTWRFHLRPGVAFSNGEPFTSDAVVTNLEYLISPEGRRESVARVVGAIAAVRAVDDLTVDIVTKYPDIMLPSELAIARMTAPGQWRKLGPDGFARAPIGTGPFKSDNWDANKIELSAFRESWIPPKVDRLTFVKLPDPVVRAQALLSDNTDIAITVGPEEAASLAAEGHSVHISRGAGAMGLALLKDQGGPVADRRVRLALNYAVDKQRYIDAFLDGATVPASQATPSFAVGFDPALKPFPYDPDRARALLKEAGYESGFTLVAESILGGSAADSAIFQAMAQDLAKVGVTLEVRGIPNAEMIRKVNYGGWAGQAYSIDFNVKPSLDAMRGFAICLTGKRYFCDDDMRPEIEAALGEFDLAKRTAIARRLLKRLHDDPPMLFMHETIMIDGLHKRVRAYKPLNLVLNFHEIDIARE
ncbi:MAG: ABC transporter substrate-binding protein [Alphaproteobacteria bacterium]|nr:ABC transporter substrate-binding protein [Alphaproteobacteria bacterium]